jgi:hypothetical protein
MMSALAVTAVAAMTIPLSAYASLLVNDDFEPNTSPVATPMGAEISLWISPHTVSLLLP